MSARVNPAFPSEAQHLNTPWLGKTGKTQRILHIMSPRGSHGGNIIIEDQNKRLCRCDTDSDLAITHSGRQGEVCDVFTEAWGSTCRLLHVFIADSSPSYLKVCETQIAIWTLTVSGECHSAAVSSPLAPSLCRVLHCPSCLPPSLCQAHLPPDPG